jgi:putative pyruvate formate lyase activating enzyme
MMSPLPSYIEAYETGVLSDRIEAARDRLKSCDICPRQCGVDRTNGETGICRTGLRAMVSSYGPHFGEEGPLVGRGGSGTIFMTHCNLLCVFCQNYDISHEGAGQEVDDETLAGLMVSLMLRGVHNINFVTPSHVVPQILAALPRAIEAGLNLPLVYNSGGYDAVETLALLDGIFDIYMPDFKFWLESSGRRYCGVNDYPVRTRDALREMHRQKGVLKLSRQGLAETGLLVRHLVMPGALDETRNICRFIAREISPRTYVNIMGQYRPCGEADRHAELNKSLSVSELRAAEQIAREEGLLRLDERRGRLRVVE